MLLTVAWASNNSHHHPPDKVWRNIEFSVRTSKDGLIAPNNPVLFSCSVKKTASHNVIDYLIKGAVPLIVSFNIWMGKRYLDALDNNPAKPGCQDNPHIFL